MFLALNAANLSSSTHISAGDGEYNTIPSQLGLADSGQAKSVAQGKDGGSKEEISRSFEEPDFALLSGKQPSERGCDVPLSGQGESEDDEGKLVFLGIFSTALSKERRDL